MGTATLLAHSPLPRSSSPPHLSTSKTRLLSPLSSASIPNAARSISLRPNDKHLPFPLTSTRKTLPLPPPVRALLPGTQQPQGAKTLPAPFSYFSFPSLDLSRLTPLTICKWSAVASLVIAAAKKTVGVLLNPFFWMYFSWSWLFWPWILAAALAAYGLYCLREHAAGRAGVLEQLAVVTSSIAWLTLVPPAHFNGYLEGWPIAFFFVYHYFFFLESTVRRRLYGDLYPRSHDPKWDVNLPPGFRLAFAALVFVGHWLAASEGPELHLVRGGWANVGIWVSIATTIFMRYHSILYLAKYSEKVVVPSAVAQFGPYRWVRHPIYASTMLLFASYCIALRAPLSFFYVVAACLVYYGRKTELEENLMMESFGEMYAEYTSKVRYKFIPLLY